MLPFCRDAVSLQELHDTLWSGGDESRFLFHHAPQIHGMETIYVLGGLYGLGDFADIDMGRQGKLDDETIHFLILIQLFNFIQQLNFGDLIIKMHQGAFKAYFGTAADLVTDVGLRSTVASHQNSYQMRRAFTLKEQSLHPVPDLSLYQGGDMFAVYQFHLLNKNIIFLPACSSSYAVHFLR